jgi:hypothetical protein
VSRLDRRNRIRSALLWGVVSVLATLVAVQGVRLAGAATGLGIVDAAAVAVGFGAVVAALSYALEARLVARRNGRS